ncbi:MAG: hypothetical protein VW057_06900 [Rhodospirillaceae bacterium]
MLLDREVHHPGYWPGPWPVECGGNRRQKAAAGALNAATRTAHVVHRRNDRWNVMVVGRGPGEWFLGGTMAAFTGSPPFGWVERIDGETLQPLASSSQLACGEHVWCGAILAHANGDIYSVNGSYLHRLDAHDMAVKAERELPVSRSHNGLLVLADGSLITKDLRLEGQGGTTVTRLDPDSLALIGEPLVLPEGSMGRIAADLDASGKEAVYVPGTEHLWRLDVVGERLQVADWRPRYRQEDDIWGLAWDGCLADGYCWLMDCGDIESVRRIHEREPNGRFSQWPGNKLSWRLPSPRPGRQRLLRVALDEAAAVSAIEPFAAPGGGIIAPPVQVSEWQRCIAWDSINGGLAGIATDGTSLEVAWRIDTVRPSMQPVVFPESGELVINDFTADGSDDLIVVDIATGQLLDRVATGARLANGMFLTADGAGGVFYCTTTSLARVSWS